ncbi:T9SS type A sorting domain-containing protein [candidate division KSB1 bacterium]|nr:T9SS type A sorting domain-containing protein [candidate division KSB1 bacterium]
MKNVLLLAVLLSFHIFSTVSAQRRGFLVDRNKQPLAVIGYEKHASFYPSVKPHSGNKTGALGPGMYLMTSYYDYGSNGGVLPNIVDYGDGTIAIARMGAMRPDTADLGSYWTYFDGIAWWPQMDRVARFYGKAWSNLSALADGRSVVAVHTGEPNQGNEVSFDALKGFAIWTTATLSNNTALPLLWPRLSVDGADKVLICSSVNGMLDGIAKSKEVTILNEYDWRSTQQVLKPDTTLRTPQFSADDQAMDSFGNETAIAVAERGGDIHLWETQDSGQTWSYRNLTNYPRDIPVGTQAIRPWDTCDLIYDNAGGLHIFWEAVRATQDTAGTTIELWHSREVGIQHWEAGGSIQQVVAWKDLPNAQLESDADLFRAGDPFDQINADATLTMQPQAGVAVEGELFLLFAAYRPLDFDTDSTHFTDIYALGSSFDNGVWGTPINLTNTLQSEDLWASLADNVGDSLRFVYQSDDNTGNSIIGGGAAPTTFLCHAVSRLAVPISERDEIVVSLPKTLTGRASGLVAVPVALALQGKSLATFAATINVDPQFVSFADYTPGPIVPAYALQINSLAPDKVRIIFSQGSGAPIQDNGLLATLAFRIDANAQPGEFTELRFSDLSATEVRLDSLQVRSLSGKITVLPPPGAIHGAVWNDLNANGQREPNEPGVAGWKINLTGAGTASTQTDTLGNYSFLALEEGVYVVKEELQEGWTQTFPYLPGRYHVVPLALGQIAQHIDFGNWQSSSIQGLKWFDKNGNGVKDSEDHGLSGWQIQLVGTDTLIANTDYQGKYSFPALPPGVYMVAEVLRTGWEQTFPGAPQYYTITLEAGQNPVNLDFGNWAPNAGAICGITWHDMNGNGVKELAEPILPGCRIQLRGADSLNTSTDAEGRYCFSPIPPGQYDVVQIVAHGWQQTFPAQGGAYEVVLQPNQTIDSLNFGNKRDPVSIDQSHAENLPATFFLFPNTPNPFNPGTKIKYALPHESHVLLEIFNVMGVRVAVLADEIQSKGHYEVEFNAETLPSGLYICKLTAPGFVAARKMLLLH